MSSHQDGKICVIYTCEDGLVDVDNCVDVLCLWDKCVVCGIWIHLKENIVNSIEVTYFKNRKNKNIYLIPLEVEFKKKTSIKSHEHIETHHLCRSEFNLGGCPDSSVEQHTLRSLKAPSMSFLYSANGPPTIVTHCWGRGQTQAHLQVRV